LEGQSEYEALGDGISGVRRRKMWIGTYTSATLHRSWASPRRGVNVACGVWWAKVRVASWFAHMGAEKKKIAELLESNKRPPIFNLLTRRGVVVVTQLNWVGASSINNFKRVRFLSPFFCSILQGIILPPFM
jgi:hypothetical protein